MRSSLAAKNMDLDSQIQLLSRVQFITRFSSHLILLSGTQGSGKTWLAHRYLEQYAQDAEQALLSCSEGQTLIQQRSNLLKQFNANPMFNEQDSLLQSAKHLLPEQTNLVIIVDDAQFLAPELLVELWALVRSTEERFGWQINILLFAEPDTITKPLHDIAQVSGMALLELEISELSAEEVSQFSEMLLGDEQLGAFDRRELKERLSLSQPRPGALQQLPSSDNSMASPHSSPRLSPMKLLVGLVVLLFVTVVGWFGIDYYQSQATTISLLTPTPTPLTPQVTESTSQSDDTDPVIDNKPLPMPIHGEGLTVGRQESEAQRMVVPSKLVDAMIDEQSVGGTGESAAKEFSAEPELEVKAELTPTPVESNNVTTSEKTDDSVTTETEKNKPAEASPQLDKAVVKKVVKTESTAAAPATTKVTKPNVEPVTSPQIELANTTTLLAKNSRHYAIQLSASMSWNETKAFVKKNKVQSSAAIYKTRRDGKIWFIVISGDYKTVKQARAAIRALPNDLKALRPWPKPYKKIQQEIERLK
ncbi:AAA family ATPase [Photobacterium lucens]|uniref:AAA family ATPase n=1 Tax=Photobacterium lucens TaxID=2562949 RepID=UPI00136E9CB4|nr:AAA family ATPase [Photobacterium lucens]MBP2698680.1 AAA family ATPase [Vibrio parahaemolyticus]MZG57492.1 cell division protein DamX [Photobacterium lucens]MZG81373.1 cell division protein DamX [Photobacterium lucens]